jgi:hypothetical protein
MACTADINSITPSGVTSTVTRSSNTLPPVHSERGDAAAALPARTARGPAPRRKTVPVGEHEAPVENLLELPAVVGLRHRIAIWHLFRSDQVAAPQRGRVELHRARRGVEQAFDDVDRLRPAGAAIGADGGGVGHHRGQPQVDDGNVVDAGDDPGSDHQRNRHGGGRCVCTDIGDRTHPQRQYLALRVERHLGTAGHVAAVHGRKELLQPIGAPFHRPMQRPRREGGRDVLRVDAGLHAEAATDIADAHRTEV